MTGALTPVLRLCERVQAYVLPVLPYFVLVSGSGMGLGCTCRNCFVRSSLSATCGR